MPKNKGLQVFPLGSVDTKKHMDFAEKMCCRAS